MKKRLLPIPLILLIPIVLLVAVVLAGVYRFSLSNEEIMAKFPPQKMSYDPIVEAVFDIQSPNPWTILVPETKAYAFMDTVDSEWHWVSGEYDAGAERGTVQVSTQWLTFINTNQYLSVLAVSNQGSGVFYYLASFEYDNQRKRMVLVDTLLLGDRIKIEEWNYQTNQLVLLYRIYGAQQAMSEEPNVAVNKTYGVGSDLALVIDEQ